MNQDNERNNFDGNAEESGNIQADNVNQETDDYGETAGALTDAVTGAMIGSQYGLFGTVIGGLSGAVIGSQMVDGDEGENDTASNNGDVRDNSNSME
ncbi:hypothetical protein [Niallia oryzisoli]|uniref:hypothetical protein n=1 Tax=Niallia oryzisoli TaxID=1737571 RepID=UPI003736A61B